MEQKNIYAVAWTFYRHIHRHREYRLVLEFIEAESEYLANFKMMSHPSVRAMFKKGFTYKMQIAKSLNETNELKQIIQL